MVVVVMLQNQFIVSYSPILVTFLEQLASNVLVVVDKHWFMLPVTGSEDFSCSL